MPTFLRKGLLFAVLMAAAFWITGCAMTQVAEEEKPLPQGIQYQVSPSAEITSIAYCIKPYQGADHLHISVTVKNTSTATKRFRVNLFLPDGNSAGGLYPRKVKSDAPGIPAGKEHTREFPMLNTQLPTGFTIIIKELG